MKKNIFYFSVAATTFVIGIIFFGLWLNSFFLPKLPEINETNKNFIQVEQIKGSKQLSIDFNRGVIACGRDAFGNAASFSSYTTSGGTTVNSTLVYGLKSEKKARKRLRQEVKNAVKVIELSPYLDYWQRKIGEKAIAQFNDRFVLVKYKKETSEYSEDFQVSIIETSTLQQAIDIDKEQESFANSLIVNKLN